MVASNREIKVRDPGGRDYWVRIRPEGVTDLTPAGLGVLIWLVQWVVHGLRHRGHWWVEVLDPKLPGKRNPIWAKSRFTSVGEAQEARDSLANEIIHGEWHPRLGDKGDL